MSATQNTLAAPEETAANQYLLAVTMRAFPAMKKMAAPDAARLLVDVEDILAGRPVPTISKAARDAVEAAAKALEAPAQAAEPVEVLLVDLSSIAHPIWHMSQSEPDPNHASIQTVAKVRALASGQKHVAVCCDSGKSFRAEIDPSYKAQRPESDATLQHQITLARETLLADGFPVWAVKGFEADDLIATGTRLALEAGFSVLIASSDKDLLQLVNGRVRAKSLRDGAVLDAAAVVEKFGVRPEQMRDYLSLVGDSSDNVKGAKGIGPVKAKALLGKFGTLDTMYAQIHKIGHADLGIKPSEAVALDEFEARYPTVRSLIALREDVKIPFTEILNERVPKEAAEFEAMDLEDETAHTAEAEGLSAPLSTPTPEQDSPVPPQAVTAPTPAPPTTAKSADPPTNLLALRAENVEVLPAPAEWERGLDPRSMEQARKLALDLYNSRMFSAYGTPQAVLSTIMVGRELGLPAMASLRSVHNIEGKHTLSAGLLVALVIKSGLAEYFRPVSFSETEATFETLRKGPGQKPVKLTHTIEMARTAGLLKPNGNWTKVPTDMLVARAQSRLARLVYPDLLAGLYTPEELQDARENGNGN